MPSPAEPFTFKSELPPRSNVEAFFEHMAATDKQLAELLRDNLDVLLRASERDRGEARKKIAHAISEALDAPADLNEGGPN